MLSLSTISFATGKVHLIGQLKYILFSFLINSVRWSWYCQFLLDKKSLQYISHTWSLITLKYLYPWSVLFQQLWPRFENPKFEFRCTHPIKDVVQGFGKIRYLVSVQDSLTPSPSFFLEKPILIPDILNSLWCFLFVLTWVQAPWILTVLQVSGRRLLPTCFILQL